MTSMLEFDPLQRLFTADIIGHPWLAEGGIATTNQVREEL